MTAIFPIQCWGRNADGDPVLNKPVDVELQVFKSSDDTLTVNVKCPYNTGGHGQRCKASHPKVDKLGDGVLCPYSVDLPYAIDKKIIIQGNRVIGIK